MTLDTVIIAFGAFVALLPFLQFPINWQTGLSFVAGLIIVGLGIIVRRRRGQWETLLRERTNIPERETSEFSEEYPEEQS